LEKSTKSIFPTKVKSEKLDPFFLKKPLLFNSAEEVLGGLVHEFD